MNHCQMKTSTKIANEARSAADDDLPNSHDLVDDQLSSTSLELTVDCIPDESNCGSCSDSGNETMSTHRFHHHSVLRFTHEGTASEGIHTVEKPHGNSNHVSKPGGGRNGFDPLRCIHCGKRYTHKRSRRRHEKTHTGVILSRCQYCDKTFMETSDLRRHERIHTGEKPYKCQYQFCGKSFSQPTSRTIHERMHTGEKPYKCERCNKSFKDMCSLTIHERIHTGAKPYKCRYCNDSFARSSTRIKHERRHHLCEMMSQTAARSNHGRDQTSMTNPPSGSESEHSSSVWAPLYGRDASDSGPGSAFKQQQSGCDFADKWDDVSGAIKQEPVSDNGSDPQPVAAPGWDDMKSKIKTEIVDEMR